MVPEQILNWKIKENERTRIKKDWEQLKIERGTRM